MFEKALVLVFHFQSESAEGPGKPPPLGVVCCEGDNGGGSVSTGLSPPAASDCLKFLRLLADC